MAKATVVMRPGDWFIEMGKFGRGTLHGPVFRSEETAQKWLEEFGGLYELGFGMTPHVISTEQIELVRFQQGVPNPPDPRKRKE